MDLTSVLKIVESKKVLNPIDEMFADPWQVDIQELFDPDYSCTKFLTTAKSVKYDKSP
jgi:hypothetical protein